jgi:hypothetical protein
MDVHLGHIQLGERTEIGGRHRGQQGAKQQQKQQRKRAGHRATVLTEDDANVKEEMS